MINQKKTETKLSTAYYLWYTELIPLMNWIHSLLNVTNIILNKYS